MPWTMNIATPDLAAFINRLEKFDKDVSKELKQEMRKASGRIANEARGLLGSMGDPLSNWTGYSWNEMDRPNGRNLQFNRAAARSGLRVNTNRYRASGVTTAFGQTVVQRNAAGAILELAGSDTPNSTFNSNIIGYRNSPIGKIPRILGRAYYRVMPVVRVEIQAAIRRAEKKVGL